VAGLAASPPLTLDGPLLDVLLRARAAAGTRPAPEPHPVVVVAIDEASLESPELAPYPRALFSPVWARLAEALVRADARAIGFDLLFTYTGNRLAPDYDRAFLETLAARRDRIVLARSSRSLPAPPFLAALDADEHSLGLAEVAADADGVHRHVRRAHRADAEEIPSFAAAVLARAGGRPMPPAVLLAPREAPEAIPTYAIGDVLRCADAAPDVLATAFAGRIVLVGSTLPDEDRKLSSARFLPPAAEQPPVGACGLRRIGTSRPASALVPGVHLHAVAIDAVQRGHVTRTTPGPLVGLLAGAVAGLAALAALTWSPWRTVGVLVLGAVALFAVATGMLGMDLWLPPALPLAGLVVSPALAYVVRYLVEERTRRRIERAFGRYLSPHVVMELAASSAALQLGGERRDVTVMFADLSGFTALSATVSPEVLTRLTNEYLGYIVDAVDATGGYVDKFIGDAVMAVWGAPAPDADHAGHAVRGALDAARRIHAAHAAARARGDAGFTVKIGLNSGPAVVGNVGTERRYNYTAVGETVNVASRLESAPPVYGCAVVAAERTAELARDAFVFRELDRVRVKGREAPLTIFEPLAARDDADVTILARKEQYEAALAEYRAMRFAAAAVAWRALRRVDGEPEDGPASVMATRARDLGHRPPEPTWNAVWTLTK
jgi:class 3 adenylate cyclase/CHASE2 domain-containing sensor protein